MVKDYFQTMLPESQDCFQVTSGSNDHSQVKLVEGMNGEVGFDKFIPITFPFKEQKMNREFHLSYHHSFYATDH